MSEGDNAQVCVKLLSGKLGTVVVLSIDTVLGNDSAGIYKHNYCGIYELQYFSFA